MDKNYLKYEKPIAVLGAGALGKAIACDCKLAGNSDVRICDIRPYSDVSLNGVEKSGITITGDQINLYGFTRSGRAYVDMVTDDVSKAVKGAGIIIIAIPGTGHEAFFKQLIPCLEDGMIIHIIPDNYGCFKFRKLMRETGCCKDVIVGGWLGPDFDARVIIEGGVTTNTVRLGYRALYGIGCAFPEKDTDKFFESTKYIGCFDSMHEGQGLKKADSILGLDLSLSNPILHTAGLVMGASVLENFESMLGGKLEDFSIYSHAFCPSISKVQYQFYLETLAIGKAMGLDVCTYSEEQFYSRESIAGVKYMGKDYSIGFNEINHIAWGTGPTSVRSRYLTEDVPIGCHLLHLFGKLCGVKTPVIDSLITLASTMLDEDYFETGMQFDQLGLNDMTKEEMVNYARTGERPEL